MWLAALKNVRWFPYAATIAVIAVNVLAVYGLGYMRGSHKTEQKMHQQMNQALADQMKRMQAQHKTRLAAAVRSARQESSHAKRIDQIERPTGDCSSDDWVRAFNDGVRAVNTFAPGVD